MVLQMYLLLKVRRAKILGGSRQLYGPAFYKLKHVFIVRRSLRAPRVFWPPAKKWQIFIFVVSAATATLQVTLQTL